MTLRGPALMLVLLLLAPVACGGDADSVVLELVPAGEAAEVLDAEPDAVLLDIRTPEEFVDGHIAGSVNIDFYAPDFADRIGQLDRDTTYVVYCRSGNRSASAMSVFADLGFTSVYEIDGGVLSWVQAGLPITG